MPIVHSHDYPRLIRRWRAVAGTAGMPLRSYGGSGRHRLFWLASPPRPASAPSIYFSAGIHGDEPAATEALVTWAEKNVRILKLIRAVIFPCLNPWGLANNSRLDAEGRDLNRCYNTNNVPWIEEQRKIIRNARFDLALMLHEDFDAAGMYIYETGNRRPHWAEQMLLPATRFVPAAPRGRIEGRAAKKGVLRYRITPGLMPDWPEAFLLHFHHAERTFTIETPSEFHIDARVAAHVAALVCAVRACRVESARRKIPVR